MLQLTCQVMLTALDETAIAFTDIGASLGAKKKNKITVFRLV